MSSLLEAPEILLAETDYHAFNLVLWEKMVGDPELVRLDFRIETDEHGQMIMSPPPAPPHGRLQKRIGAQFDRIANDGESLTECPVSTRKGVKAADVAWASDAVWAELGDSSCFRTLPEICVEVLSPSNTVSEIKQKKTLYFEEGVEEVWICRKSGAIEFYLPDAPETDAGCSVRFPDFSKSI